MTSIMSSISIVIILLLIISLTNPETICPGYGYVRVPENCTSTCSSTLDQCPTGTKCCYRIDQPCGFHCITPKDKINKSGRCPTTQTDNPSWSLCDAFDCDVDNDCQSKKKCCSNLCSSKICIDPS